VSDAHAVVAVACGAVVFLMSVACCAVPQTGGGEIALALMFAVASAWSSAFALVTRGGPGSRIGAWTGLTLSGLAVALALASASVHGFSL